MVEVTTETIAMIAIVLVAVAIIGGIFLTLVSTQATGQTQDLIVELLDAEYSGGRTYFTIIATFIERIDSVTVSSPGGGACTIFTYDDNPDDRTVRVYGYCDGDLLGGALVVTVTGPTTTASTNVEVG